MRRIDIDKSQPHKVSTVFLLYAEPFLEMALSNIYNPTSEQMNIAIRTPWIIWNSSHKRISCLDQKQIESFQQLLDEVPDQIKPLIESMMKRRNNEFGEYEYFIGDHTFYIDNATNEMKLRAESRVKS